MLTGLTILWLYLFGFICVAVITYLWNDLRSFQKCESTEAINYSLNKGRYEESKLVSDEPYYNLYKICCITVKYCYHALTAWCLKWNHTYNIFTRVVVYICYITLCILLLPILVVYGILKAIVYYALIGGIIILDKYSKK